MTEQKQIFVEIPPWFIKDKEVNQELEIVASLQRPIQLENLELFSPAIGFFSALELIESKFFLDALNCDVIDVAIAICIAVEKDKAFPDVLKYSKGDRVNLAKRATKYLKYVSIDYPLLVEWLLVIPFAGFEMIHSTSSGKASEFIFGADTIALITSHYPNVSQHEILWNISLCSVGFSFCQYAREQGNEKSIYRAKDLEHIRELKPIAIQNEKSGQLHEWQILRPDLYSPSQVQIENRIEIVAEHKNLLDNFNKDKK